MAGKAHLHSRELWRAKPTYAQESYGGQRRCWMGWFGKGLGDKRTGEIALVLLKKRMVKDGAYLTADERAAILEKAQTMGLKTEKELMDFAK